MRSSHPLSKGGDFCPQLRGLIQWERFAEEGFGENFPCGEGIGHLILQLVTSPIPQGKWEDS